MKRIPVSFNSFHLIRLALVSGLLFSASLSSLVPGVSTQQQNSNSERKAVAIDTQISDPALEEARNVMHKYLDDLPDFICQQVVERYYDLGRSGVWHRFDTLTYELTYNHGRESYQPINVTDRPVARPIEQTRGPYSTGDFADGIAALFDQKTQAVFKPAGKERLGDRQTLVYKFRVPRESSTWEVKAEGEDAPAIIAGYSGAVWIDEETKRVWRMDQAVDDLPTSFPVTNSESSVSYGIVKIQGLDGNFLLPVRAEFIIANRRQKHYFRNLIYFKSYRKFETGIKILDDRNLPLKKQ